MVIKVSHGLTKPRLNQTEFTKNLGLRKPGDGGEGIMVGLGRDEGKFIFLTRGDLFGKPNVIKVILDINPPGELPYRFS